MSHRRKTQVTVIRPVSARPAGQDDACLVVIYGAELGKKYPLGQSSIVIGRSSNADIQVDQESVSRSHAEIVSQGNTHVIRDQGSTNGTYVNDRATTGESSLRDGDFVKIGRTIFKFLSGDNIESAYHQEIYQLTTVDGLTQIFNKRYFMDTLEREISRAHRYQRDLSLLMFDIDHFKEINDSHGHLAGDQVLKELAAVINKRVRREDIFSRYGGEEFTLVLPEVNARDAMGTAEKIRRLIEKTVFRFEKQDIPVTISGGVASQREAAHGLEEFIAMADEQLYRAKREGRNRICGRPESATATTGRPAGS